MKKHLHQRTEESFSSNEDNDGDDQNNTGLSRKKKVKKNNSETEADSCFVARVTASNLHNDALYLPKDFISPNGMKRKCGKIFLTDEGERSWELDMRFKKSSDTFYITQGWRNFCEENGKKVGSFFMFKLMKNRETPLLSFCPAESRGKKASKKESLSVEPNSGKQISKEATSPSQNRFVTLTVTHDSLRKSSSIANLRENGLDKPGVIILLGKDGTKWLANLRREATGTMYLGKGWKDFAKANSLKTGESFMLESIWENRTPMLSLFSTESTSDRRQQRECLEDSEKESISTETSSGNKTKAAKNNKEERRDSSSAIQNRFVTLTLTPEDVRDCKLILPSQFMKANGINKLGKMTLLGKNRMKWFAYLLSKDGIVALGCGWKGFCEANGVKIGGSFILEFIDEKGTNTVFKFCSNSGD